MMKWLVELGEHEIKYLPRNAIEGYTLVDFLIETYAAPEFDNTHRYPEVWKIFVDGALGDQGSRANILLISLDEDELTYT